MTRRVIDAANSASPAATVRTAWMRSSAGCVLEDEPGSPGAKGLEDVLIEIEGRQDEDRRVRVRDEAAGGFGHPSRHLDVHQDEIWPSRATASIAARPSAASPTTRMSGSDSRIDRSPDRIMAWSSTRTSRIDSSCAHERSPAPSGRCTSTRHSLSRVGPAFAHPPNRAARSRIPSPRGPGRAARSAPAWPRPHRAG